MPLEFLQFSWKKTEKVCLKFDLNDKNTPSFVCKNNDEHIAHKDTLHFGQVAFFFWDHGITDKASQAWDTRTKCKKYYHLKFSSRF